MSKSKIRDMDGIIGKFNESKAKIGNSINLPQKTKFGQWLDGKCRK